MCSHQHSRWPHQDEVNRGLRRKGEIRSTKGKFPRGFYCCNFVVCTLETGGLSSEVRLHTLHNTVYLSSGTTPWFMKQWSLETGGLSSEVRLHALHNTVYLSSGTTPWFMKQWSLETGGLFSEVRLHTITIQCSLSSGTTPWFMKQWSPETGGLPYLVSVCDIYILGLNALES